MTLVAVAMIVPVPALAEVTATGGTPGPGTTLYNYYINPADPPSSIRIGPGAGDRGTPATHVEAGGTVYTPVPPTGSNAFIWTNGILTVDSGNRFPAPPPTVPAVGFSNDARSSILDLRSGNFTIDDGAIRVNAGIRPGYATAVPSLLQIDLYNYNLTLTNNSSLSVSGNSRVDIGIGIVQGGGTFSVENSTISIAGGSVLNIFAKSFYIIGDNSRGGGRINIGAIIDRDINGNLDSFTLGNTLIQTPNRVGNTNNSISNDLYFFSRNSSGISEQEISVVAASTTLTLSGRIYADVNEQGISTSSTVTKTGAGTLYFTGAQFARSQLLNIKDGKVAFTARANLGDGKIQLNGIRFDPSNQTTRDTALEFRGDTTDADPLSAYRYEQTISNDINMEGTGRYAGGTIGVIDMNPNPTSNYVATLITTGIINVSNGGTLQKTGAGRLDIQGTTIRKGILDIQGGDVRIVKLENLDTGDIWLNGANSNGDNLVGTSLIYGGIAPLPINNNIKLKNGGAIRVEDGAGVLTLTGKMGGSGTLYKGENGVLFLNGEMEPTLDLFIHAGTVRFEKKESLVSRNITINGTRAILEYSLGSSLSIGNQIILAGTGVHANRGGQIKVTDKEHGKLTLTGAVVDSTIGGVRKPGSLRKTGDGILALNGLASFTGEMYIEEGTLEVLRKGLLDSASGLRMEDGTTFIMREGAHQTLHGISGIGAGSATILIEDNTTLTLIVRGEYKVPDVPTNYGEHKFEGAIHGDAGTTTIVITAVDGEGVGADNRPITLNLGDYKGNLRLKEGTKRIDNNSGDPYNTLFVTGNWTPGKDEVHSTLTFDLTTGAMPLGAASTTLYPSRNNPFGISVSGDVDFETTDFRVWIDSQVTNGKYHVGHIETTGSLVAPDSSNVRRTLFQSTWVESDTSSYPQTVDVYTDFTGFSGLNGKLAEFSYSGLTDNQNQVAFNIDRFRVITTTKEHAILKLITAVINAEDQTTNLDATVRNLKDLLTQLSGDVHANAMFVTQHRPWQFAYQRLTLDSEMYFRGGEATSRGEMLRGQSSVSLARMNRIWVSPTYSGSSLTSDGNARGATIDRVGFQLGYDRRIKHNATAGLLFGYNSSNLKQWSDRVQVGDVQLGSYFSAMCGYYIEVRGYGGVGFQNYESTRIIDNLGWLDYKSRMSAAGRADGWSGHANLEVARPLFFGMFILRPTLALDGEYAARNAFEETGDEIALRVGRSTAGRFAARAGFSFEAGTARRVSLTARLFGGAQVGGDEVKIDTQFVGIGAYPMQNIRAIKTGWAFLEGGIGTRCYINSARSMAFHADYNGSGSKNLAYHAVSGGFSWMY